MTVYLGKKPVGVTKIVKKEVVKTKFGVSIDNMLGDVDENGEYTRSAEPFVFDGSAIKYITGTNFRYVFNYTDSIVGANFSSLISITGNGFLYAFYNCPNFEYINLDSLELLGTRALRYSMQFTKIKSLYFPSLISVQTDSFGNASLELAFRSCYELEEIHFRADMQATIESMYGYSSKFGATNAEIYFDLIGTITVNGVAYSRSEINSIYVNDVKTYVAWKDSSDSIVYTDATAEPAVGTIVYSDQGTTQVGTVSGAA